MSELLGLRARLAAALVGVSALTLIVTALLVLIPLDRKLEQDLVTSLEETTRTAVPGFARLSRDQLTVGSPRLERAVRTLRRQTDAEAFVFDASATELAGTDIDGGDHFPEVALALQQRRLVTRFGRDEGSPKAHVAVPFTADHARGVLVLRRSLGTLHDVEDVVRRSLVAAAFVALAVALVAGIALAAQLVRRLTVLRSSALDMAERGLDGTAPVDDGHRDEVGDLARAFATMQRRLAAQEQSRRTFVSTASHELRTPLTSLGLMLHGASEELTRSRPDLPEARDQLRRALGQTDRLAKLADELLDLSRLDAGVELRAEPVELVELGRSVLAEFEVGDSRGELSADGPTWVHADPGAIARIARILLNNAHHHGGADGRIVLRVDHAGPAIEVTDAGPGVPPGDEEQIFERFRRGAEAGEDGGFGLGLAIGRELARQMGGDLTLEPSERGARFRAMFPAAEDDDQPDA
ncbi:MAG: HAMP domain-containing sensor histidine kinase [Solirubrobacteraceae bacterium]